MYAIVRVLRFASVAACLIVIASFAIFVFDQSRNASNHQTQEITGQTGASSTSTHESSVHEAIDEASEKLTSPFAGVVSSFSSQWLSRGVKLLLALAVYGFGLGFLARMLRVRA